MSENKELVSKVLVLDGNEIAHNVLKVYFNKINLVGLRANAKNVEDVLKSQIEFGAVLISEDPVSPGVNTFDLAYTIHKARPDLPILLRRQRTDSLDGIPEKFHKTFTGVYTLSKLEILEKIVNDQLFDSYYPADIVEGIQGIAEECFRSSFKDVAVEGPAPFLARDNVIGESNSLIALESKWCRGYLMLQVSHGYLLDYIANGKTALEASEIDDHDAAALMSHLTNEIWGGINREFMSYDNQADASMIRAQVPIYFNPETRYISFGTTKPQLCYHFSLTDSSGKLDNLEFTLRLIFNLDWSPENFEQSEQAVEDLVESGELEFF